MKQHPSLAFLTHLLCEVRSAQIVYQIALGTYIGLMSYGQELLLHKKSRSVRVLRPCAK